MDARIDLVADLNDEDDEGLGWSTLSEASDPARIRPGVNAGRGEPPSPGGRPRSGRR